MIMCLDFQDCKEHEHEHDLLAQMLIPDDHNWGSDHGDGDVLNTVKTTSDGNCFFRSFSRLLTGLFFNI